MPDIHKYISDNALNKIRDEIVEAKEREILFIGRADSSLFITEIDVVARGSDTSVAAVLHLANYGDVFIHNHPSGPIEPSDADVEVASLAAQSGVGSFIINNSATEIYVLVEPMEPPKISPISAEKMQKLLDTNGPLAQFLDNYEERHEQRQMMAEVIDAFNRSKISAIEAGTGTGKTLAYLLPAVAWALKNGERVVISTHTINLQEQILSKDLPIINKLLPKDFRAILVKGRNNYICLRKCHTIDDETELFEDDESKELQQLFDWAFVTKAGDKSDLNFLPKRNVWEKVHATGETCIRARCPFFKDCFVTKARRAAAHAQILVTNHALLFSDIAIRAETGGYSDSTILPNYTRIIFDEAHNIEEVATKHFGSTVTRTMCVRTLNLLYRKNNKNNSGALVMLGSRLLSTKDKAGKEKEIDKLLIEIQELAHTKIPAILFSVNDTFKLIAEKLIAEFPNEKRTIQYRLTDERYQSDLWKEINDLLFNLSKDIKNFVLKLNAITKAISKLPIEDDKVDGELKTVNSQIEKLCLFVEVFEAVCNANQDGSFVNWLEAAINDTFIYASVNRAPLNISDAMVSNVYEKFSTVVMTSATLTSRKKFDFWESRIGLDKFKEAQLKIEDNKKKRLVSELILETPFDFKKQAALVIPTDVDTSFYARGNEDQIQGHSLKEAIMPLLKITNGNAFVLFTSYGLLKKTSYEMKKRITGAGMTLFVQGDERRDIILRKFREQKNSVLFGTDSFWAGVDVVGESLKSVIITKLPFRVPTEPIIEARTEYIDRNGGNAFLDFSLPMAIIKFRQGFGRLIRSKTDFGMVTILDRRILDKFYGRWFLQSLPECSQFVGALDEILPQAKEFIEKKS